MTDYGTLPAALAHWAGLADGEKSHLPPALRLTVEVLANAAAALPAALDAMQGCRLDLNDVTRQPGLPSSLGQLNAASDALHAARVEALARLRGGATHD